jgi:hypothetical protein
MQWPRISAYNHPCPAEYCDEGRQIRNDRQTGRAWDPRFQLLHQRLLLWARPCGKHQFVAGSGRQKIKFGPPRDRPLRPVLTGAQVTEDGWSRENFLSNSRTARICSDFKPRPLRGGDPPGGEQPQSGKGQMLVSHSLKGLAITKAPTDKTAGHTLA